MGLLIFIIILVLIPQLWPYISRWITRYAAGKLEDRMRTMMGMPTRAEEKKAAKQREETRHAEERDSEGRASSWRDRFTRRSGRRHPFDPTREGVRMMRLYAEDAEYVEIREYSASLTFEQDPKSDSITFTLEEQLSEAEYQIIR